MLQKKILLSLACMIAVMLCVSCKSKSIKDDIAEAVKKNYISNAKEKGIEVQSIEIKNLEYKEYSRHSIILDRQLKVLDLLSERRLLTDSMYNKYSKEYEQLKNDDAIADTAKTLWNVKYEVIASTTKGSVNGTRYMLIDKAKLTEVQ